MRGHDASAVARGRYVFFSEKPEGEHGRAKRSVGAVGGELDARRCNRPRNAPAGATRRGGASGRSASRIGLTSAVGSQQSITRKPLKVRLQTADSIYQPLWSASLLPNVFACWASSGTEELDEHDTSDETPDMSKVRDATLRDGRDAADSADELDDEPTPDQQQGTDTRVGDPKRNEDGD